MKSSKERTVLANLRRSTRHERKPREAARLGRTTGDEPDISVGLKVSPESIYYLLTIGDYL